MKLNFIEQRRHARPPLPRFVFAYVDGGAEDEHCLRSNADDLSAFHLLPTALRDTVNADTGITVFGKHWARPVGVAPVGFAGRVRPHGTRCWRRLRRAAGFRRCCPPSGDRLERCAKRRSRAILMPCSGCSCT